MEATLARHTGRSPQQLLIFTNSFAMNASWCDSSRLRVVSISPLSRCAFIIPTALTKSSLPNWDILVILMPGSRECTQFEHLAPHSII